MCRQISCVNCLEKTMSDSYPEYLNPFAEDVKPKKKLTIRDSFKEMKRTFRQSFRIKKKDEEVTIRQKPVTDTLRRLPVSYPSPEYQGEALPRSRFHERVSRMEQYHGSGPNPFEEEEKEREIRAAIARRRVKKRAAPPPPKSLSSQNINDENLEIPAGGSHWSLTSIDTDCSVLTDNPVTEEQETKIAETFRDFNKNMESLKDDTNNNVITKDIDEESSKQIPDLVVSCPSDSNSSHLQNEDEDKKLSDDEQAEEEKLNVSEDDTALVVRDITNNLIKDDNGDKIVSENGKSEESFLFYEDKSLYIAGSTDHLNESDTYMGRVSLYITGSRDDLDASNNNDKSVIDENSSDDAVPIPKQRKNKLTKNILLGM